LRLQDREKGWRDAVWWETLSGAAGSSIVVDASREIKGSVVSVEGNRIKLTMGLAALREVKNGCGRQQDRQGMQVYAAVAPANLCPALR
jgi:hypothetical protein